MIDKEKRKAYMREYRKRNKGKLKAYNEVWLANPDNAEKHRESCRRYYRENISEEKKAKNREYQREYYRRKKQGKKLW